MTDNTLKPCEHGVPMNAEAKCPECELIWYRECLDGASKRAISCAKRIREISLTLQAPAPAPTPPASDQVERVARAIWPEAFEDYTIDHGYPGMKRLQETQSSMQATAFMRARAAIAAMRDTKGGV